MTRGRPKATGRFATREHLVEYVWHAYRNTPAMSSQIARQCRVSQATDANILKTPVPDPRLGKRETLIAQMRRDVTVLSFGLQEDIVANDGKLDVEALHAVALEFVHALDNYRRI